MAAKRMRSKRTRTKKITRKPAPASRRHQDFAQTLRQTILDGGDQHPVRLPSQRELSTMHKVSWGTVSKAMDLLAQEGLIERAPSRGTFTVPAAIRNGKHLRQARSILLLGYGGIRGQPPTGFYDWIYLGIVDRIRQAGYEVGDVPRTAVRSSPSMNLPLPSKDDAVLGAIFLGVMNEEMIRLYTDAGYPTVSVDYWTTNPKADAVVIDCYTEGQVAAEFLLRQGHTHLFYLGHNVGRPPAFLHESDADLMLAGVQRALALAGLPPLPPERIDFFGSVPGNHEDALKWLLSLQPRPTAGVVFSGGLCQWLIDRLPAHGIRCPEDISFITKTHQDEQTDITSMQAPTRALGELAVDMLLDRATGRRSLSARLVVPSTFRSGRTVRQIV